MEKERTLDRLPVGQRATVMAVTAPEEQGLRLLELGFVPGGTVTVLQESPWGDPVAYGICGAVIALRQEDAHHIFISGK